MSSSSSSFFSSFFSSSAVGSLMLSAFYDFNAAGVSYFGASTWTSSSTVFSALDFCDLTDIVDCFLTGSGLVSSTFSLASSLMVLLAIEAPDNLLSLDARI